jgi:hypothetical protein
MPSNKNLKPNSSSKPATKTQNETSLEQQAVNEILGELFALYVSMILCICYITPAIIYPEFNISQSQYFYLCVESVKNRGEDSSGVQETEIPLLLQNRIPDGFETDEHMDVSLRADEVSWNYFSFPFQKPNVFKVIDDS